MFLIKWFYNNQYITKKTFRFFSERFFLCQYLFYLKSATSLYPIKHYRGFMLPFTREFGFLAATEVDTWQRTHNLAVLITERCAPKFKNFVDYRTHKTRKMLPHLKYFSECSDFFNFFAYLCNVIDDFCLFRFAALSKVKNLTW